MVAHTPVSYTHLDAGNRDDVARARLFCGETSEGFGEHHLGDTHILGAAVVLDPRDSFALVDLTMVHTQQRDTTEERRRVKVCDCLLSTSRCV